jgi:dipeptidase
VKHGFYGADGGAGETLMVGDPQEAFVFHILSDPTGKSAIWAAQRVPDDAVTVVANMFTIREVNTSDAHNYLVSANLHSIARAHGLWDGKGLLDFTATYSRGEYAHKYYSGRRMWDSLRHFKPSLKLPAEYGDLKKDKPARPWGRSTYPWAVVPDAKVSPAAWMDAHRSHYEGTPYDTSQGLAAGPFGTPDRYATVGAPGDPGVGTWERTVSIYRTTYTWIVQAYGVRRPPTPARAALSRCARSRAQSPMCELLWCAVARSCQHDAWNYLVGFWRLVEDDLPAYDGRRGRAA